MCRYTRFSALVIGLIGLAHGARLRAHRLRREQRRLIGLFFERRLVEPAALRSIITNVRVELWQGLTDFRRHAARRYLQPLHTCEELQRSER